MSSSGFVPFAARIAADATPLALPPRPAPPPRPSVPWLASAVPVIGALGFWALTGSVFALWFALLGPLIAVAGVLDGVRTGRRARREALTAATSARERLSARIDERHAVERAALNAQHPDVAGFLARRDRVWRSVPDRAGVLVVGEGFVASETRVSVTSEADADDAALARRARTIASAPVVVPIGTGVAVVGPEVVARSVVRALVLQLALAHPPGSLEIVPAASTDEAWPHALPHAHVPAATRVLLARAGDAAAPGDTVIVRATPDEPLPPWCGVVLTVAGIDRAVLEVGATASDVEVESVGSAQADALAAELAARWDAARPRSGAGEALVPLAELRARNRTSGRRSLAVAVATAAGRPFVLDLVRDGPHAVVTGMTGAGKSELLVSWIVAMCAAYRTEDVAFLLADFKGGTAFDALTALPHVTGVITDLDARAARRAIESLRAEVRHREGVLAQAGARDVADVELPRLVVVVDEFAALRDAHPELETLFGDLAARGRALGVHLVLGTQRASGVLRDALLANCALRVSLRVADRIDSRAVLGVDDAAELPGGDEGRGIAYVRRAADARPVRVRVALSTATDVAAAARDAGEEPRRPWLPELPDLVPLQGIAGDGAGVVVGLADEPDHQRQSVWRLGPDQRGVLAIGAPGAGKSMFLQVVAAQVPEQRRRWIGPEPEQAWDALMAADAAPLAAGTALLLDDLDALLTRYPDEHARTVLEVFERVVRAAGRSGAQVFATATRVSGAVGRVADLFPCRLLLATAHRADHVAAGGDARDHVAPGVPGRGVVDGRTVQVAFTTDHRHAPAAAAPRWEPPVGVTGFVSRRPPEAALELWQRTGVRLRSVEEHADPAEAEPGGRVVVVGAPEKWLGRPRLLERLRVEGTILIDAACERDLRHLVGDVVPPPFADPARGRGWDYRAGARPRRVSIDPLVGT